MSPSRGNHDLRQPRQQLASDLPLLANTDSGPGLAWLVASAAGGTPKTWSATTRRRVSPLARPGGPDIELEIRRIGCAQRGLRAQPPRRCRVAADNSRTVCRDKPPKLSGLAPCAHAREYNTRRSHGGRDRRAGTGQTLRGGGGGGRPRGRLLRARVRVSAPGASPVPTAGGSRRRRAWTAAEVPLRRRRFRQRASAQMTWRRQRRCGRQPSESGGRHGPSAPEAAPVAAGRPPRTP